MLGVMLLKFELRDLFTADRLKFFLVVLDEQTEPVTGEA